jgi:signal transduction histidine kinase
MLAIVNRIDATATRMTDLINELLDLSHLQISQPLELVRRPVDLIALIQQVVAEQQQTTHRHQLRIESAVTELVGDFDAARISRVIANLISNAIKYSPRAPEITVQIAREEIGGAPYAVVTVRDQGIGIPAEDLPYIFEQFRRAENVIGRIKGTGIGLASVRQIVEQHGGTITVESVEGEGSAFTVRLPLS